MATDHKGSGEKLIATNPLARANYFIDEVVEAGVVLTGTEVKSLRAQAPNLRDSFVDVKAKKSGTEAWLLNAHIAPYSHGNIWNHEPLRPRKLLLHRHQIEKMFGAVTQKGLSVIPLRMYFKSGRVKLELGMGRGKKKHDKRQELRKKSAEREMDQALKRKK
ncbi:MAG: SsrA-binding protein [Bdellovibrionales bacterium GWB1_55_8]|nr:MAG: SsrA-binding protein [Bdellovibrionales bacterium GWB1_55_8]